MKSTPHKTNNAPKHAKHSETREQAIIDPPNTARKSRTGFECKNKKNTDARTIDNLEAMDPSTAPQQLVQRWREILQYGVHRQSEEVKTLPRTEIASEFEEW